MPRRLLLVASVVVALAATACSPSASPTTTTSTSIAPPPTTTSTTAPTTTSTAPAGTTVSGAEIDPDALALVTALYRRLADPSAPMPKVTPGALPDPLPVVERPSTLEATASTAVLADGVELSVLHVGDDLILLVGNDAGWRIAGADLADQPPWLGPEPAMVLVIGSDARVGEAQTTFRADSLHVLTAVPSAGTGAIVGFPRDSYVSTPFGKMKISSLMAGRGPEVMADEVRAEFGIPVEGYVVTGFKGFEELMWELGPLPIEIPFDIPTQKYWAGWNAGEQTLSPQRVLEFARTRKKIPGGDFGRSVNQGRVMLAVLRMFQLGTVDDAPQLVAALERHTWTDLSRDRLLQLAVAAYVLDPETIANVVLPGKLGRDPNGASVVYLQSEARDIVADLVDDGVLTPPS